MKTFYFQALNERQSLDEIVDWITTEMKEVKDKEYTYNYKSFKDYLNILHSPEFILKDKIMILDDMRILVTNKKNQIKEKNIYYLLIADKIFDEYQHDYLSIEYKSLLAQITVNRNQKEYSFLKKKYELEKKIIKSFIPLFKENKNYFATNNSFFYDNAFSDLNWVFDRRYDLFKHL